MTKKITPMAWFAAILFLGHYNPPSVLAQTTIGCFVEGECKGGFYIDITQQANSQACLHHCKETVGCRYWTYYGDSEGCLGFANCNTVSSDNCADCESGDVDCVEYQCDVQGLCKGGLVSFDSDVTYNECVETCYANPECEWWAYDVKNMFCNQLSDCLILDESCAFCLSGQSQCYEIDVPPPPVEESDLSKLLIVGGEIGSLATGEVEIVDVSGDMVECDYAEDFPYDVEEASSFTLDGEVIVCGGYGTNGSATYVLYEDCYKFNNGTWDWFTSLAERRRRAASATMNGYGWITGGFSSSFQTLTSTEKIYPDGSVVAGIELPLPLEWHCLNMISDRYAVLSGGYNEVTNANRRSFIFDELHQNWTEIDTMIDARYGHVCEVVDSDEWGIELIVAGGGSDPTSTEILNLQSFSWDYGPALPSPVNYAKSVQYNETFLIVGGDNNNGIYEFDIEHRNWTVRPETLNSPKSDFCLEIIDTNESTCEDSGMSLGTFWL